MITGLVLTLNEENIIKKCLKSLSFVDEILIFDSFSDDKTIEIAKSFNAKVLQRKFDNYSSQRNAALKAVNKKSDWILMIDADEVVTKELRNEVIKVTSIKSEITLYSVRRKDIFNGKWLRYSSGYPTWFPRLFKKGSVKVEREINEEYTASGVTSKLNSHLLHYPFNKGLHWWFHKHNNYSEMEAVKMVEEINESINFKYIFSNDAIIRRRFFKRFSYKIPFRPQFIFFIFYILKLGFLDGKAGYDFCRMRKVYETMIDIKFKNQKN